MNVTDAAITTAQKTKPFYFSGGKLHTQAHGNLGGGTLTLNVLLTPASSSEVAAATNYDSYGTIENAHTLSELPECFLYFDHTGGSSVNYTLKIGQVDCGSELRSASDTVVA